jgi:hypothetical protein
MLTFLSVQTELILFLIGTGVMLGYALVVGNGSSPSKEAAPEGAQRYAVPRVLHPRPAACLSRHQDATPAGIAAWQKAGSGLSSFGMQKILV